MTVDLGVTFEATFVPSVLGNLHLSEWKFYVFQGWPAGMQWLPFDLSWCGKALDIRSSFQTLAFSTLIPLALFYLCLLTARPDQHLSKTREHLPNPTAKDTPTSFWLPTHPFLSLAWILHFAYGNLSLFLSKCNFVLIPVWQREAHGGFWDKCFAPKRETHKKMGFYHPTCCLVWINDWNWRA